MIHSMTGYGKATSQYQNKTITVEIKSLNSKTLDLATRIPPQYREKELEIRNTIAAQLLRGKVDLCIHTEDTNGTTTSAAHLNTTLIAQYAQQITEAAQQANQPVPTNIIELALRLPDSIRTDAPVTTADEYQILSQTLDQAIQNLQSFRQQEGQSLHNIFTQKIDQITQLLTQIEPYETQRTEKIKARLEENLKTIEDKIAIDRNRLEQEMIYYIEKLDINEEKNRLRNHLQYYIHTMNNEPAPGKKLGFIAQEIGREINTLGSKSNHSQMQNIVVRMKDELEQIKEQILNVL